MPADDGIGQRGRLLERRQKKDVTATAGLKWASGCAFFPAISNPRCCPIQACGDGLKLDQIVQEALPELIYWDE